MICQIILLWDDYLRIHEMSLVFTRALGLLALTAATHTTDRTTATTTNACGCRIDFHVSCDTIRFKDTLVCGRAEEVTGGGRIIHRK